MKLFLALLFMVGLGSMAFATSGIAGQSAADGETCPTCPLTAATAAEGETQHATCPIATALEDVELSEHGHAVLALGKAGKPVWIQEAGFGLIDGEMVDCPVHFSTYMTHHIAAQGAESGCAMCQAVVDTAAEHEACDETCDTATAE